ncbi:selenium cofactor biosynthesis protein YqeC [Intestinirhabdus alba]|jgi:probable selenium-dependent hydroxylase accessory protein YqeC|uniref:Selenium-dependent hydroxylase accessory protein YqeC n=1 Tax=Intestinirhabdus alba TaxID=2899544 RepID=A0A6L6IR03_9ENTR|nr:selenium cofactor biosynthesis protein YqeC [Intestinirhabdus alba]MTH48367.1 putative selenium-dependent hydroxylase accessory protein YqeC [Intestinirhabdus alba]
MENIPHSAELFYDLNAFSRPLLIAAVGAGGKTSALFWLAGLFQQAGRRVLLTTTTHMFVPTAVPLLLCRDPLRLPEAVWQRPLLACFSAWLPSVGKVRGFSPALLDALVAQARVDVVLVEADGAHGFALKAPAEHEPCIPQTSRCVIAVTGGGMLGRAIGPSTVHRWPLFSRITDAAPNEALSWPMLYRLIRHPQGAFKGAPEGSRRIWLINQLSQNENLPDGGLLQRGDIDAIWAGAVQERPAITRRRAREGCPGWVKTG